MSKKSIHIVNQSGNEILLYGYIGTNKEEGEIGYEAFQQDIKALAAKGPVTIKINSGGGSLIEGLAIVDMIQNMDQEVIGIVEGMAASMAGLILQACDKRIMTTNSRLMIHKAQMSVGGDSEAVSASLELLKQEDAKIVEILQAKTGQENEVIMSWLQPGTNKWFSAQEALKAGLIDEIREGVKVKLPKNCTDSQAVALYNSYLIDNNHKKKNDTMKKIMINLLNSYKVEHQLTEESQDTEILNVVENALKGKDAVIADLTNKVELANKAKIETVLQNAVKDGRITAEQKDTWNKVLTADFESGSAALAAMSARVDVNGMINRLGANQEQNNTDPRAQWTFNDWGKKDPKGLANMKATNQEKYQKLFEDQYGA